MYASCDVEAGMWVRLGGQRTSWAHGWTERFDEGGKPSGKASNEIFVIGAGRGKRGGGRRRGTSATVNQSTQEDKAKTHPFFLNTKDDPMKSPLTTARMIPTICSCVCAVSSALGGRGGAGQAHFRGSWLMAKSRQLSSQRTR